MKGRLQDSRPWRTSRTLVHDMELQVTVPVDDLVITGAAGERPMSGPGWLVKRCHVSAEDGAGEQKMALGGPISDDDEYPLARVRVLLDSRRHSQLDEEAAGPPAR